MFKGAYNQTNRNKEGKTKTEERINSTLKELSNITQKFVCYGYPHDGSGHYVFATDDNAKEFILVHSEIHVSRSPYARKGELSDYQSVDYSYKGKYSDILTIELLINDDIVETEKKGALSRATVGGLLFGAAGAIVGASSAKSNSYTKISSVILCITVNDANKPLHKINIINPSGGLEGPSFIEVERAREMYAVLSYIMKSEEKQQIAGNNKLSIADELQKIVELKEKGLLDENEFSSLKKKIINNS